MHRYLLWRACTLAYCVAAQIRLRTFSATRLYEPRERKRERKREEIVQHSYVATTTRRRKRRQPANANAIFSAAGVTLCCLIFLSPPDALCLSHPSRDDPRPLSLSLSVSVSVSVWSLFLPLLQLARESCGLARFFKEVLSFLFPLCPSLFPSPFPSSLSFSLFVFLSSLPALPFPFTRISGPPLSGTTHPSYPRISKPFCPFGAPFRVSFT